MKRLNPQNGRLCACKKAYLKRADAVRYYKGDLTLEKKAYASIQVTKYKPCSSCSEVFYFELSKQIDTTTQGDERLTTNPSKWNDSDYTKPVAKFSMVGSSKLKRPADINIPYMKELERAQRYLHESVKRQMMNVG